MKNYYFKNLISVLVFFLTSSAVCFGQLKENTQDLISFIGLEDSYVTGQLIEFYIKNDTKAPLFFYCSLEENIEGQWREIILSIQETKITKSIRLWKIEPNKKYKLVVDPNKEVFKSLVRLKKLPDYSGRFRFRVEVIEEPAKGSIAKIYSKEFIIK